MRFIVISTMLAALVGCAINRLSNEVKPYVGRDIQELAKRLGNPTGKRETTGDRVYVWSAGSDGTLRTDTGPGGVKTGTMAVRYECTLEVTVDAQNVIQSYQIDGSNAGCVALRRN